jgi:diguanylate cyclase (GGDEF)-like protein
MILMVEVITIMKLRFDNSELGSDPATVTSVNGQAALRRRLVFDPELRSRSMTGAVLWALQAAIVSLQQFGEAGSAMPSTFFHTYLVASLAMSLSCLVIGPRLPLRVFRVAEEVVVLAGWAATALLVAATGGVTSPDLALYANVMFYCAYFMPRARATRHIALGTALIWAPLLYDGGQAIEAGFLPTAFVMTVALWSMVAVIARGRSKARSAELGARRQALTDPLTGVGNLRTFTDETERAVAAERDFAVAFVDVNGLKAANTVHGHAGGDQLIRRTADALLAVSGRRDQVARVGGDEFALLVMGADQKRMEQLEAEFALSLNAQRDDQPGPACELSASIGSAVYPQDGNTFDELMRAADLRMYDSKQALPERLPTPGTAGGRSLSEHPEDEHHNHGALLSEHPWTAIVGWLAIPTFAVALFVTGGPFSPLLPLAYLAIAFAAHLPSERGSAIAGGTILGILLATMILGVHLGDSLAASVVFGQSLVIGGLLRLNRQRSQVAEREARLLSRTDPLTGLANRRVFEESLAASAAGFERRGGGLILADVDNFKAVNNNGGHVTGDEVLRLIASVLEGTLGDGATLCRIGGDEFAAIVHEGDAAALMRSAAKCRAAVGAVDWEVVCENPVTLSFGYAAFEQVGEWKELVVAADVAMRLSKEAGKNKISAGAPPVPRVGPTVTRLDSDAAAS